MAVRDVEHERVGLGGEQRLGALEVAAAHADRRGHAQAALRVARRVRIARLLLEVAQGDHAGDAPVGVGQRQLLDAMLGAGARAPRPAPIPGGPVTSRSRGVMWPATASPPSPARRSRVVRMPIRRLVAVDDEQARDAQPLGLGARLARGSPPGAIVCGSEMTRVRKRFTRVTSATSSSTERKRCSDADAAELRERDRHRRGRDRVHVGRDDGDLERDPARQLRARRDVGARADARAPRDEQDVVERQGERQLLHQRPSVGYESLPMATASLSTHVLDTGAGRPASGVDVELSAAARSSPRAQTDADGRARLGRRARAGRLPARPSLPPSPFFRRVELEIDTRREGHYHVPLLVSPYSCASYRGS